MYECSKCKKEIDSCETYEYRGAYSCEECFDDVIESRNFQRQELIAEENAKTEKFKGLDFGDNVIGRGNREILKHQLEIASKESVRLKEYERRNV